MTDILIAGGGIIGMLTARELSLAGMKVTIVDQGEAGQESSWAGGGILSPLYPWRYPDAVSVLAKWGQTFYPELIEEINSETGLDAELIQNGLLILDNKEMETALGWAKVWQAEMLLVDKKQIREIEPALSPVLANSEKAIWMPDVMQIRNPRFVKAMKIYLLKQKVNFIEKTQVSGFLHKGDTIYGVQTSSGILEADKVLLTAGAWSSSLLKSIGIDIDVKPVKGQMILFKTEPDKIKRIILSQDRYVIPRRDGRILLGSTLEHTDFDKSTTAEARDELMAEAVRIIPFLQDVELEHHWAGLRPGSPKGVPYICAISALDGLYVNAGHYRNGVGLGPASARLMADLLLSRAPIFESETYAINRM